MRGPKRVPARLLNLQFLTPPETQSLHHIMKTPRIVLALLALAAGSLACAADQADQKASTEKAKKPPEWAGLFGDASLPLVWQSASAASDKIAAALAEKKLDGIPDWAETSPPASHPMQSQAKADTPERQANLSDAFRLSARIADDITAGAWSNDVTKTNDAYQRAKVALAIAQRSLPKEIVAAPPQAVRFAKKVKRDPAENGTNADKK